MSRYLAFSSILIASLLISGCGSGGSSTAPVTTPTVTATLLSVSGVVATRGIFDPAPRQDGSGNLWMSYSTVNTSANDANLTEVRTRIASSTNGGSTWTDVGVDPNNNSNPDMFISPNWTDWHYEVSSLLYDPFDPDSSKRWKMLWHRMLYVDVSGVSTLALNISWIGLSTASTPNGTWSAERKLFVGSTYNASAADPFIGAPEIHLDTLHASLNGCAAFTEPSMLAKSDAIYISMQCLGSTGKIIEVKCNRTFSSCSYLGDFLTNSEASQFTLTGQAINGFAATELVTVGSNDYLIVTPYEPPPDSYRGCLAFSISNLSNATLARTGGAPTLIKRISGTSGSFNGACGYDPSASNSGIIYSEYSPSSTPNFRMFASHVTLP